MTTEAIAPVVLSHDEAAELYRFTQHDYIAVNTYPALSKLLSRVERYVKQPKPVDRTVGDVARSSAERWDLPLVEDASIPRGRIELVHRETRDSVRAPGVYIQPGADLVSLSENTGTNFENFPQPHGGTS